MLTHSAPVSGGREAVSRREAARAAAGPGWRPSIDFLVTLSFRRHRSLLETATCNQARSVTQPNNSFCQLALLVEHTFAPSRQVESSVTAISCKNPVGTLATACLPEELSSSWFFSLAVPPL